MDSIFINAQRKADYNVYLEIRRRYESGCATKRVYKKAVSARTIKSLLGGM